VIFTGKKVKFNGKEVLFTGNGVKFNGKDEMFTSKKAKFNGKDGVFNGRKASITRQYGVFSIKKNIFYGEEEMSNKNFIPSNANAFSHFAQNLVNVVSNRTGYLILKPLSEAEAPTKQEEKIGIVPNKPGSGQWMHVPYEAYHALHVAVLAFEEEHQLTPSGVSRGQITARNEAQKKAESQIRYFVRFYLRNPVVPDRDLVDMNIPVLDTIRTPHTEVTAQVDLTFRPSYANQVVLAFRVVGAVNRARPANTTGLFVA